MQTASTTRSAWVKSPMRPASGALSNLTAVPAPSTRPSCSGSNPRELKKAGRNGEATPNAIHASIKQDESCQRGWSEKIEHGFPPKLSRFLRFGTDARPESPAGELTAPDPPAVSPDPRRVDALTV